jgi:hypothetical protein
MAKRDDMAMPSGAARKRTKDETIELIRAYEQRLANRQTRVFSYPFEDKGNFPLEAMHTPKARGHWWRNGADYVRGQITRDNSSTDYYLSDTQRPPQIRDSDKLSLFITTCGLAPETEQKLADLVGAVTFDVRYVEEALLRIRDLDEDDPVRTVIEKICTLTFSEYDVLDERGNLRPGFETIEWSETPSLLSDFYICSVPRGTFWQDDGTRLKRPAWAKDFATNKSIIGLVRETLDGYDFSVFVPSAYKINSHSKTGSAVFGSLVAEGKCESACEAMVRASYYLEACAAIPVSDFQNRGFVKDEVITTKTQEVKAIAHADRSYADIVEAQRKAAFRALPEAERRSRIQFAKKMEERKGPAPKDKKERDEVLSRIHRPKGLDERGARAAEMSAAQNRAQVPARIRA